MLLVMLGSFSVANASDKSVKPTKTEIPAEIVPLLTGWMKLKPWINQN